MSKLKVGSLFSGIGGFELGFERTGGFETVWQCENDPYAIRVLEKHWPDVRRCKDVRDFPPEPIEEWKADIVCGGFPCQGISSANYRAKGLLDERSGLWFEFARILGVLRPRYAVLENVPALSFRGLDTVLGDLAKIGYDAEWQTLPANAFGAPHRRERIFIVAHPSSERCQTHGILQGCPFETASQKQEARIRVWPGEREHSSALPDRVRWCPDRELLRMVDGIPDQLDRYRMTGNAVVPQIAEWIGRRIIEVQSACLSR